MMFLKFFFLHLVLNTLSTFAEDEEKLTYQRPSVEDTAFLSEPFHSLEEFQSRWVLSAAKKDGVEEDIAKYDGEWKILEPKESSLPGDHGLILASQAKHAAVSTPLDRPFKFEDKPLIVQYEVRFQNKHECGGAYLKLLADTPGLNLAEFTDKTEYTIMFGPDRCGNDNKLHFIFQHENPVNNKMEEKHAKKPSSDFGHIFEDGKTHLVTLVVQPDNTYQVLLDRKILSSGSLLNDMEPPVNPPKMIDDPNDSKPEDWDEREKIPDSAATKPDDWDEDAPTMIEDEAAVKPSGWLDDEQELTPDPAAVKPEDWDEEEDGEWEAPQIDNPNCKAAGCGEWKRPSIKNPNFKGKWSAPLIVNPAYKGIWAPRKIDNPDFFEDTNPFGMKSIKAVGFELWSMQSEILFDNLIVADDMSIVDQWTLQTWELKKKEEKSDSSIAGMWEGFKDAAEEKPWLWIIAVACLFVPIVLIVYFCTGSSKADEAGRRKKTDEAQPDDEVEAEADEENEEDGEDSEKNATADEDEIIVSDSKEKEDTTKVLDSEEDKLKVEEDDNQNQLIELVTEDEGEVSADKPKIEEIKDDDVEDDKKEEKEAEPESENVVEASEEQTSQNEEEVEEVAQASPRGKSKRKVRKD